MKPLLYIAAALMMGAGIYGFVDYEKKSRSREMQSLYTKEENREVKEPIPAPDIPEVVPAAVVTTQKEAVVKQKDKAVARKSEEKFERLNLKIYSRAIPTKQLEVVEEEPVAAVDTIAVTQ